LIIDHLIWLLEWYASQCDGDWENKNTIQISTINNPGWGLSISLVGTELENMPFQKIKISRTENDWVHCFIRNKVFEGACGALNFAETLQIFHYWVESCDKENKEQKHPEIIWRKLGGINMIDDNLTWLIEWYHSQCNGDWEHSYGVHLSTTGNPCWSLTINLQETELELIPPFPPIQIKRTEHDWLNCSIENKEFNSSCSLFNLPEVLQIFRNWVERFE